MHLVRATTHRSSPEARDLWKGLSIGWVYVPPRTRNVSGEDLAAAQQLSALRSQGADVTWIGPQALRGGLAQRRLALLSAMAGLRMFRYSMFNGGTATPPV